MLVGEEAVGAILVAVFGILTADGKVDVERTRALVEASEGMETTFHRAVDMTEDYAQAVEDVIAAGCTRILTSGGYDKAIDGIDNIRRAVEMDVRLHHRAQYAPHL